MICPKCGRRNPESGKFCNHCGALLQQTRVCSRCGTQNPQTNRFCDHCGANLEQANICPRCGAQYGTGARFCRHCGESLTDSSAVRYEGQGERQTFEQKQRHGCLTALLVVMIIGSSMAALAYLIGGSLVEEVLPGYSSGIIVALTLLLVFNIVCTVALLKWKKWGFWGLVTSTIIAMGLNFNAGLGPLSLLGLINIGLLYGVLQIGTENKGWPQLE